MKYLKAYEVHSDKKKLLLRNQFVDYVSKFYTSNDLYGSIFNYKLTVKDIEKYVDFFIEKRGDSFEGDSFDREIFRDFLLFKLGYSGLDQLEYTSSVKGLLTDLEINANKYNI